MEEKKEVKEVIPAVENEPVEKTVKIEKEAKEIVKEPVKGDPIKEEKKPVKKVITGHIVNCVLLNMREAPSVEAPILDVLNEKAIFKILNKKDEFFYEIEYKGVIGYCMKKFVEEN